MYAVTMVHIQKSSTKMSMLIKTIINQIRKTIISFCMERVNAIRSPICPPNRFPKINAHVVDTPNHPHSMAEKCQDTIQTSTPSITPTHIPPLNANKPKFTSLKQWQKSFQRVSKLESDRPRRTVVVGAVALGGNGGLSRKVKSLQ